ncbi:nonessential IMV membrane protein [Western grey kangaroopox virus]|uniref:Nonessential IMV membrane protein n=2 Tax=Macropopoxvirus TaxID=2733295 RepID=A0A2C9DT83_9POXV|nr:nonessential IMV membrane protein [Western grey kangaroopox virus]YP_010085406.1 nonessential IMV membrane protein [Eastern grey kangaroopox virus]ATI21052.1 nonessential IMV membrane protein [Western grey kangaroopox virus]ATI21216.1 nonessential IMV membrane protein [Eastern grey kangaroopox virus]ATX75127.1 nonessential IMV membrane protein [Eastern grey kangaroopox virus]
MINDYEPLLLMGFIGITLLANHALSVGSKFNIIFSIHSVFFMWFLYHFMYSVL